MARDHALARDVESGRACLRLYRWERATISFGRNEPARRLYDPRAIERAGLEVVRRSTGGRAVVHDRELTYAVVLPLPSLSGLRDSYAAIHRGLSKGLALLGLAVEIAVGSTGRSPGVDAGPCFGRPAPGEIVAGGRKLVGSAQARVEGALLQHGSILVADDQPGLKAVAVEQRGIECEGSAASLSDFLDPLPSWEELEGAVISGIQGEFGGDWDEARLDEVPHQLALEERYRSEEWTWRR